MAYGFMRNDEWGCDLEVDDCLPCTMGNRCNDAPGEISVSSLTNEVYQIPIGGVFPRANIAMTIDGHLVASYADGIPLLAYGQLRGWTSKVVVLNYYPAAPQGPNVGIGVRHAIDELTARAVKLAAGMGM
jgi:hypothetical protein